MSQTVTYGFLIRQIEGHRSRRNMSVTSLQFADNDRYLGQIDKIIHSHSFRKAESLCRLLSYLANHAIAHPGVSLKEYQIAIEVFGRPESFDPQTDAAIRVQAGRLRSKLNEYYTHEGISDPIVVEMPNGVYALAFHEREVSSAIPGHSVADVHTLPATHAAEHSDSHRPDTGTKSPGDRKWLFAVVVLSVALVVAVAAIAMLMSSSKIVQPSRSTERIAPVLRSFWSQFTTGPDAPRVIFSNAAFVGRPETGMRYLNPARDSRDVILDHYTGVGEVLAVHDLDNIFSQLNDSIDVKRGSLFTLDDAKDHDLIFVGSPAENLTLLDMPGSQEFVFRRADSGPHKEELGIVNVHPDSGEPSVFYPTNSSQPLAEDYAIIALVHGLNPERHMLILAGTTTIGTQAAVEFVCEKESLQELQLKLAHHSASDLQPFEALLHIKVAHGVPVGTELIAVRPRK